MFLASPTLYVIRNPRFPTVYFSSDSMGHSIAGKLRSAFICSGSLFLSLTVCRALDCQPTLLHAQSDVETGLVPARFSL